MTKKLGCGAAAWKFVSNGANSRLSTSSKQREVWRHVTMVALFLDDNKTKDDGDSKENGKKYMFILTNNNSARGSRYSVHFFAVDAQLRHETS